MSDTARMDAAFNHPTSTTPRMNWQLDQCYREGCKLERELAEARTSSVCTHGTTTASAQGWALMHEAAIEQRDRLERELDEVREKLADWENSAAHVEADHPDEVHCSCVPILRKLLCDARLERDEARAEVEKLCEELESHAWTISPAMAQAKIDELCKQRDRLSEALRGITDIAERVDGWESFPSKPIEIAREALAAVEGGKA